VITSTSSHTSALGWKPPTLCYRLLSLAQPDTICVVTGLLISVPTVQSPTLSAPHRQAIHFRCIGDEAPPSTQFDELAQNAIRRDRVSATTQAPRHVFSTARIPIG
jgi:hypothetical protein